jgi:hypothetical protein
MNEWMSAISTIGFPIVSFLISAYFIKYSYDKQIEKDKQSDEREDRHWEEISKLTAAVNNNTEVLRDFVKNSMGGARNEQERN